jgi:hypothetical protein
MTILSVPAPWIFAPHGDQEFREVHHLGFPRRVLDDGFAIGQRRRHHEVLRAGDRHGLQHQARTLEDARRAQRM